MSTPGPASDDFWSWPSLPPAIGQIPRPDAPATQFARESAVRAWHQHQPHTRHEVGLLSGLGLIDVTLSAAEGDSDGRVILTAKQFQNIRKALRAIDESVTTLLGR